MTKKIAWQWISRFSTVCAVKSHGGKWKKKINKSKIPFFTGLKKCPDTLSRKNCNLKLKRLGRTKEPKNYIQLFRWKRSISNSCSVSFDDSINVSDVFWRYSESGTYSADTAIAWGYIWISSWNEQEKKSVVEIKNVEYFTWNSW